MPGSKLNISIISSQVPRQCGIATFSNDLATSISQHVHNTALEQDEQLTLVAVNDVEEGYKYGPRVQFEIRQHQRSDYRNAADYLNTHSTDVVSLQHEYGLFGGADGNYILELLERMMKPAVCTCHTVLSEPTPGQRETLQRIGAAVSAVVVLAERAQQLCQEVYDIPIEKVELIHHGTPDVPFHDPEDFKERLRVKGRPVLMTFGLLGPGKGIENMLEALADVAERYPEVAYMIVGATHPAVKRESGESYRLGLESKVVDLGIADNVFFHNHYVTLPALVEFLKATDIYVTPYLSKEQIVSGTLAFAVACGKAIVSTPYYYAQEVLADGRGLLAEFNDSASLARQIISLLDDPARRRDMRKKAYAFGRQMIWPAVAGTYDKLFRRIAREYVRKSPEVIVHAKPGLSLSLPEIRLDHLYRMTDDTGILQHAIYSTPDRNHGYCTDDNARALLVAAMGYRLLNDSKVLPKLDCYLSFLHHAWNDKLQRFRNFMAYDRQWLDEDGTQDCQARCIWALGYLTSHPPAMQNLSLATQLFHHAISTADNLTHPRSEALCIIGFHYYLRRFFGADHIRGHMNRMAGDLMKRFGEHSADDWQWFSEELTYNNARLPQALILAGSMLHNDEMLRCGIRSLRWLLASQTSEEGHITLIGNHGWWRRDRKRAQFDQQPIEAVALVEACKSAYKATGDKHWLSQMWHCFEWYLGRNDIDVSLVDFKTRGCSDGLMKDGVNQNQGAESTLSWLLALLTMYEMHPGVPPGNGDG